MMGVAHEERGRVDQNPIVVFGCNLESPKNRLSERILNGPTLGGIVAAGAVAEIELLEKHSGADALELDDAAFAELTAIKADIVRSDAGGERVEKEKLGVPARNLEPDLSFALIPVRGEEPIELLELFCFVGDGGQRLSVVGIRLGKRAN